jgi:hypothetical protein
MRLIKITDREELASWIENDPFHKDIFWADYWFQKGFVSFVVEDELGSVMYVKLIPEPPAMRVSIQFCDNPLRCAQAMLKHFWSVVGMVKKTGANALLYDTKNYKLAAFCTDAFGFLPDGLTEQGIFNYRLFI